MDDDVTTPGAAQLSAALSGAREALEPDAVGDVLARMSGPELAAVMRAADEVAARARAAQVRLTAEAAHRGEFTTASRGVGSVHAWVREHAPSLRQDGAHQLGKLAQDVACSVPGGLWSTAGPAAGAYADSEKAQGVVWARVVTGEVGAGLALTALKEMAKLTDQLRPDAVPTVAAAMLDHGVLWGPAEARKLRPHLLAMFGAEGELDDVQKRLRTAAYLTSPRVNDADITEYRLGLTPAQAATLEAAIGPLSRPAPNEETGERDLRPAEQRRAEALAAVCAGAASDEAARRSGPGAAATTLHVAATLDELRDRLATPAPDDTDAGDDPATGDGVDDEAGRTRAKCGRVMLSRAQLTMLAPAVVRQLACDADIIPVVLGSDGEVLDLGRAVRLFTAGQRRALWHRDGGCSYPGCDVPAGWAQAHHLVHWADGGPSDLSNAALLCQRHHTTVHDRRLIANVHPPDADGRSVTWDLTPGSYDHALPARLAAIRRARADQRASADQRARAEEPAAARARLDTGPSEQWLHAGPDDVTGRWVDDWIAEEADRERVDALRNAEFDDAIATLLDEERTQQHA